MAIYHVKKTGNNSNAGSDASPWLTIQHGINVAVAGDTVYVHAGTYNEKLYTVRNGSSGNQITFKAYTGDTVIIDGTGLVSSNTDSLLSIYSSYITFDGFDLRNFNTSFVYSSGYGVWIPPGTTGVVFKNNTVHEISGAGIICAGANATVEYNTVYRTCLQTGAETPPMSSGSWGSGIQIQTPFYNDGTDWNNVANIRTGSVCRYNTVHSIYGEGIMAMRVRSCQVYGNTVYNCGAVHLYITDCDHMEVYNNLVYAIASDCATLYGARGAGTGIGVGQEYIYNPANSTYINVYNNVVIGTAHPFAYFMANVGVPKFENSVIAFNCFMDGTQNSGGYGNGATTIDFRSNAMSNVVFRNNVITQTNASYAISAFNTLTGLTLSNNIWGKTPPLVGGVSVVDGTSVVQDPQISRNGTVAAGVLTTEYFRPNSGSWVFDHGTPVSGITTDIFGTTRDSTLPTVGAVEGTPSGTWTSTLPSPWFRFDVGSLEIAGVAEYSPELDQYRITTTGTADVWGTSDEISQIVQSVTSGSFVLQYKIESYSGSATYAKFGADVRRYLFANQRHIGIFLTPYTASGITQVLRRAADGSTTDAFTFATVDRWHRITVTDADDFLFETSSDGLSWTTRHTETGLAWGYPLLVGPGVCAQSDTLGATAVFSNLSLDVIAPSTGAIDVTCGLLGFAENAEISESVGAISADTTITGYAQTSEILEATGTITVDTTLAGVSNGGDDGDMATAQNIIRSALLLNGAVAADQTISATDLDDGLVTLNNMIESWGIDRNVVYTTPTISAATVAGTDNVTLGTRPVRILSAYIRDAAAIDHAIQEVGEDDFSIIANKSTTSDFPLVFWCDYNNPTPEVKFWPVPAKAYTVYFVIHAPFTGFAALNTTVVFPPGYERALRYNLAVEMAQYSAALPPKVEEIAREALMLLKVANHRPRTVQLDPTFCGRAGRTNIYSNIT